MSVAPQLPARSVSPSLLPAAPSITKLPLQTTPGSTKKSVFDVKPNNPSVNNSDTASKTSSTDFTGTVMVVKGMRPSGNPSSSSTQFGLPSVSELEHTLVEKQSELLVLEMFADGQSARRQMRRGDLFAYVSEAVHQVTRVDEQVDAARRAPKLHARDIRKLDSSFTDAAEPSILARRHAILINIDPIRVIILRDRFLLLLPEAKEFVITMMQDQFRMATPVLDSDHDFPFEFRALEAVLETIIRLIDHDYRVLEPKVLHTLHELREKITKSKELDDLRRMKNDVDTFASKASGIQRAIMAVLESDEDLALLNLGRLWDEPALLSMLDKCEHEDAEILMETYLQEINRVRRNLALLLGKIENTQELVTIRLDTARNRLLTFDTVLSIISLCFTFTTVVSGYFGKREN